MKLSASFPNRDKAQYTQYSFSVKPIFRGKKLARNSPQKRNFEK